MKLVFRIIDAIVMGVGYWGSIHILMNDVFKDDWINLPISCSIFIITILVHDIIYGIEERILK